MIEYTDDYKKNLTLYWQQFYPNWEIPKGFHVHHIKPKCTFKNPNDPCIHHPCNLVALYVDDHRTIHNLRGDKLAASLIWSLKDRIVSKDTKKKMSKTRQRKPLTAEHKQKLSLANKGQKRGPPSELTKQRMRQAAANRPPVSEKTKKKIGIKSKGRKVSSETKAKMSEIMIGKNVGKKRSAECKRAVSIARTGKKHSLATKSKMSESAKRRAPLSNETKEKMRGTRGPQIRIAKCLYCNSREVSTKHIIFCAKRLNI